MKWFFAFIVLLLIAVYIFFQTPTGKRLEEESRAKHLEECRRAWELEHDTLVRAEFTNITNGYYSGQWFGFHGEQAYEIQMNGSRIVRMKAIQPKR